MQVAKRLARGCKATENARGVRGYAPPENFVFENAKYVILLIFSTYISSKVNYILSNNILNFHVWVYRDFQDSFTIIKNGHG
jgi:hypothetical protein